MTRWPHHMPSGCVVPESSDLAGPAKTPSSRGDREGQDDPAGADRGDEPGFRPIKYSLFPPLGPGDPRRLPRSDDDEVTLAGRARRARSTSTTTPDLVVIQVYITSARRAYEIADHYRARGATWRSAACTSRSLPDEAAAHADTRLPRPGRGHLAAVPRRLPRGASRPPATSSQRADARRRCRRSAATSSSAAATCARTRSSSRAAARTTATSATRTRSSRAAARSTRRRSTRALAEIERLPGRHLYFLDDHLFGNRALRRRRSSTACAAWAASGRPPARSTRSSQPGLLERAAAAGLRSLFVGFETLNPANLRRARASARTSAATTTRRSAGCTTSA